ncbi:amicyanin [Chthonobacter rhizosphaerae]|uniref:amicyanin n=1 Tax=Chthonobacter rhizosphaerae TaxID=2735553 RepID=UPI0015EFC7C6|nr:amicyanin [Chthonobacter rhizosphaerae]
MRTLVSATLCLTLLSAPAFAADSIQVITDGNAAAGGATVEIAKMKFATPEVTVKAGEAVTWTNTEALPHNVHFKTGPGLTEEHEGPMLRSKQTYTVQFNEPGTYEYICTPHPFMKGKVVVE